MATEQDPTVYGFEPGDWERLPQWLKTFVMESHERNAAGHHGAHRQMSQFVQEQAWRSSDMVLRTLITLSGGSLVAILAFLGSLVQRRAELDILALMISLGGLSASLLLALAATFSAYFVAVYQAGGLDRRVITFAEPYINETPESGRFIETSNRVRVAGIWLAIASVAAFGAGIGSFGVFASHALTAEERPVAITPIEAVKTIAEIAK